ncbi:anti-codon nuclease masking agent (prrB) [Helicobacter pylori]|nr:anti-codon nuclease masking agent (prrB) [Helicobacter pylori]
MHKIETLLQTLAPKGVEFRKLGEVLEYDQPNKYCVTSKEFDKSYPTPVLTAGKTFILGYTNEKDNIYQASKSSPVIIFDDFTAATQWVDFPFKVKSSAMKILLPKNPTKYNIRFIFFYMQTIPYNISGEHTRQWISRYSQITIPIPPLEIQQEIVKILDAFTELNTELKARKKQYEYYQNMLLDFNDINSNHQDAKEKLAQKTYPKHLKTLLQTLAPKGVEFRKLGDIGEFYSGLVGKSKKSFSQGNKFYVPYVNVFNNPQLDLNALESVQIGDKEKQNTIQLGDVLFTGSSENLEDCAMSCVVTQKIEKDIYLNSFCFGFRFFDENLFNPSFLKHFLRDYNFRKNISKVANGVTRFNVSKQLLSKITIPIPPLEIQQEIVKILDQFSTLTTDLLAGIPAEIEARKKQYEYYREKLLTFKPLQNKA